MFSVFVAFTWQQEPGKEVFCHCPVMQDRRNRRDYSAGSFVERWPSVFTKRTLGAAVAAAWKIGGVMKVEVRRAELGDDDV